MVYVKKCEVAQKIVCNNVETLLKYIFTNPSPLFTAFR